MEVSLSSLPDELLHQIFSHLSPIHLAAIACTSHLLRLAALDDSLYKPFCKPLDDHSPYSSFRELYSCLLHKYGWLQGLWIGDRRWYGTLLTIVYNHANGALEAFIVKLIAKEEKRRLYKGDPRISVGDFEVDWERNRKSFESSKVIFSWSPYSIDEDRRFDPLVLDEGWPPHTFPSMNHTSAPPYSRGTFQLVLKSGMSEQQLFGKIPPHLLRPSNKGAGDLVQAPVGLFVGSYGSHGLEIMLVYRPSPLILEAYKCTGDKNVPRGEISFKVDLSGPAHTTRPGGIFGSQVEASYIPMFQILGAASTNGEWEGCRRYAAVGHVAQHGFQDDAWIPLEMVHISSEEIVMDWRCLGHMSYYRYIDVEKEFGVVFD